ncbi:hypothetical protein HDU78_008511 [Chytriomyces hyalinus]|nr:hypothetical protein HDU78_008511 [Chytriomyces hyalinus]
MKRKQEKNTPAAPAKKQPKKDNTKKRVALPPDVRTLWAKATPNQAHQPETRPDDYEPGDSDFEDASLASALSAKKSANPHESRVYVVGVPYEVSYIAESVDESCLEPAPVFGVDGKATHLYFEVPPWDIMWNSLREKTRNDHEAAILEVIAKTGKTRQEIEESGSACCGYTLQQLDFWYSLRCLYSKKLNVATAGRSNGRAGGIDSRCRGCASNHNTFHVMLRRTFDIETALKYKANNLIGHKEWSSTVAQDVSYSLVLRILRNGGFIHLRTQADVDAIRKALSKQEQADHLTWIKARTHRGFRTGAQLILLTEAGMNMISFDRSNSKKKIDEIGQTVVADSWGFNRLSNSLSERATDDLLREILAGNYAEGDAAFRQRNGDGEPKMLSKEWEASIEKKWNEMSVENQTTRERHLVRLNANVNGNLVDEITGRELSTDSWCVDRVINNRVMGISGYYRNEDILITHTRINDFKEADGRKVFATVETLRMEMQRHNIVQADFRIATQLIMRNYLNEIRIFRNSQTYRENMRRMVDKKSGL